MRWLTWTTAIEQFYRPYIVNELRELLRADNQRCGIFVSTASGNSASASAARTRGVRGESVCPVNTFRIEDDVVSGRTSCVSSQTAEPSGGDGGELGVGGVNCAIRRGEMTTAICLSSPEGADHCRAKAHKCFAFAPWTSSGT
jgi:hypothetical protein